MSRFRRIRQHTAASHGLIAGWAPEPVFSSIPSTPPELRDYGEAVRAVQTAYGAAHLRGDRGALGPVPWADVFCPGAISASTAT